MQGWPKDSGDLQRTRGLKAPTDTSTTWLSLTDIAEQKRVEQQLRETNSLLEDRQRETEADLAVAARVQQSLVPRSSDSGDWLVLYADGLVEV